MRRTVTRAELRTVLVDAEETVDRLKRMVDRLTVFTDHLDAIATEDTSVDGDDGDAGGAA